MHPAARDSAMSKRPDTCELHPTPSHDKNLIYDIELQNMAGPVRTAHSQLYPPPTSTTALGRPDGHSRSHTLCSSRADTPESLPAELSPSGLSTTSKAARLASPARSASQQ